MKSLSAFFILVLSSYVLFSQEVFDDHVPPSPTAASFQQFIQVPVDMHTGQASISVPIHTFSGRRVQDAMSLAYSGGGHRVNTIADRVGLGWSLSGGGIITRTVLGHPDETAVNGYWTKDMPNTPSQLFNAQTADGVYDTKPDVYSFSTPSGGGNLLSKV